MRECGKTSMSEYGKIQTRKTPNTDTFYAMVEIYRTPPSPLLSPPKKKKKKKKFSTYECTQKPAQVKFLKLPLPSSFNYRKNP